MFTAESRDKMQRQDLELLRVYLHASMIYEPSGSLFLSGSFWDTCARLRIEPSFAKLTNENLSRIAFVFHRSLIWRFDRKHGLRPVRMGPKQALREVYYSSIKNCQGVINDLSTCQIFLIFRKNFKKMCRFQSSFNYSNPFSDFSDKIPFYFF